MKDGDGADRYIFVHRIDTGSPFESRIPLHVTLLHWFESNAPVKKITEGAREVLQVTRPMTTYATEEDLFGPDLDIPVMRLARTQEMLDLHIALLGFVKNIKGTLLGAQWTGSDAWNPHVTHALETRLSVGDVVEIDSIDLIAGHADGSRTLIDTVRLKWRKND